MNISDGSSSDGHSAADPHALSQGAEELKLSAPLATHLAIPNPPPGSLDTAVRAIALHLGRWALYIAMAYFTYQIAGWLISNLKSTGNYVWRLIVESIMMVAAILPGFAMAKIEQRSFGDFGLPFRRAFRKNFWVGSLWGLASLSFLMLALRLTHSFEFGSVALQGPRLIKFGLYYLALFLATALFEEFLLRGYSQWILSRAFTFWPAAIFLSSAFGYIHKGNPGEAKSGLIAAGLIGFFLCLTLRRTGDLWWAVGFHMAWDWGESFLYSVPDSGILLPGHLLNSRLHGPEWLTGGSVGPEGSYIIFAIIIVLWILFDRLYPDVKYDAAPATQPSA